MTFRKNFFGDSYAQPDTIMSDIDALMIEKYGDVPVIYSATIDDDGGESEFKWGGYISWCALEGNATHIEDLRFDGFDSVDAARSWLIDELGVDEDEIEVD